MLYRDEDEAALELEPEAEVDDDAELREMLAVAFGGEFDDERIAAFKEMVHVADEPALTSKPSQRSQKQSGRIVIEFG